MKRVNVIRHLAFEDLGSFAQVFEQSGLQAHYYDAGVDDLSDSALFGDDLLIVLGGPISVNDADRFPFIEQEISILKHRIDLDLPTLGICLGAQLMVVAAGGRVFAGNQKEIGWYQLNVTQAGREASLQYLDAKFCTMLHWHGETFSLPDEAVLLASSDAYENQAFRLGARCLGLQFHPEVTKNGLERWYIGHVVELESANLQINQLREDAAKYADTLTQQGQKFISSWLQEVGIVQQ